MNAVIEKPVDSFDARMNLQDGATVYISAPTIELLAQLVAKTKGQLVVPSVGVSAEEKQAVIGAGKLGGGAARPAEGSGSTTSSTSASTAGSREAPGKSSSAATAGGQASAQKQADASAQASATYDDVKRVVNALYAVKPQHAVDMLATFNAKKGTELKPEQYADFVTKAQQKLTELGAAKS